VLVLGAGSHGRAVADLLADVPALTAVAFSDADAALHGARVLGLPVLGDDTAALRAFGEGRYDAALVGIGNTAMRSRRAVFERVTSAAIPVPLAVHPSAVIAASARLGGGTVAFPGVIVGARARVGANAVLYSGAIVEHDSVIEDHVYLSPGVVLSGDVTVREGAFIGSGAVILPGVDVGREALIGAGAVVTRSVGERRTVAGVPARALRRAVVGRGA
jgi:sugar O-acyltransferase (sialic acid O-acetyltransferase NeuD family)